MGTIAFTNERFEYARDHRQNRTWTELEEFAVVHRISNETSAGRTNERSNRREDRPHMTYKLYTSLTYHAAIAQGASEGESKRREEVRRLAGREGMSNGQTTRRGIRAVRVSA